MSTSTQRVSKLILLLAGLNTATFGCQTDDIGHCCETLGTDAFVALPTPERPDGGGIPRNVIGQHPSYDCESLTCVSWQGSDPFCTRKCGETRPCPIGFDCKPVLESSPGEGASIQPSDTFCIRRNCEADLDCPEELKCKSVNDGNDPSNLTIRQCIRIQNACNSMK